MGDKFDVFIEPLVQELQLLWMEGFLLMDAVAWNSQAEFILRAVLIWCICDFPAYGMVVGCVRRGTAHVPCAVPILGRGDPECSGRTFGTTMVGGIFHQTTYGIRAQRFSTAGLKTVDHPLPSLELRSMPGDSIGSSGCKVEASQTHRRTPSTFMA
jgi:hypothetical protein